MALTSRTDKDVEVRISRRTLWVDTQAYPLGHVTRVRPLEIKPRRGVMVAAYLRQVGACLLLGLVGLAVLGCMGTALPSVVITIYELLVLAAWVGLTLRLVRQLTTDTLYVLSISTSGTPTAAVASWDRGVIFDLANRVVAAIDDPGLEYAIHVEHVEIKGDAVFGDKSGGDSVFGDKFVTGS
jgi:hypothetical protein